MQINPLTGKLFGKVEAAKNTTNTEFYFLASILMVWSQNWPRLFVDIFSLKLPLTRYQKTQIPIFEDFLENKNLTNICFKMGSYKVDHCMITQNSNIIQSQYKISIQCHTSFVLRPRKRNKQRKNYEEKG